MPVPCTTRKCAVWMPEPDSDFCTTDECPLTTGQLQALDASYAPATANSYVTENYLPTIIGASIPMRLAASSIAGATSIAVDDAYGDVVANGGWAIIDPYTVECEIRKVTNVVGNVLTVAALAYAHDVSDLALWASSPIANVKWFGAIGDGVTDDTAAIQATINAAIAGRGAAILPGGSYRITNTLIIDDVSGFRFGGDTSGSSAANAGVVILWGGNNSTTAIKITDARYTEFLNFRISASAALIRAIEIGNAAGGAHSPSRNVFRNIEVNGITDLVGRCFVLESVVDANNDFNLFVNCTAANYGTAGGVFADPAGWSIQHTQSLGNIMIDCHANASASGKYGCTTVLDGGGGTFHWIGGGMSSNTEADFYCGVGSGGIAIEKLQSEGSARLLLTGGPAANFMPISLRNIRYNPRDNLAGDNRWIDYRYEGGLTIDNCIFEAFNAAQAGQIRVSGSGPSTVCTINAGTFETAAAAFYTGTAEFYITGALHYDPSTLVKTLIDIRPEGVFNQYIPMEQMVSGFGAPVVSTIGLLGAGGGIRVATLADAVQSGIIFSNAMSNWSLTGNATLSILWAGAVAGVGDEVVRFQARVIRLDSLDLIDGIANVAANLTVSPVFNGTAKALQETAMGAINLNTDGIIYKIEIVRRADSVADTYDGNSVYLVGARLSYARDVYG